MCFIFYHMLIPGCIYLGGRKIGAEDSTILRRNYLDWKEKAFYNFFQVSGLPQLDNQFLGFWFF